MDRVEHACRERAADPTGPDRRAHGAVRGGIPEMMVGAQDHAGAGARIDHRARVGERQRQRLLAQHVLAGGRRGERLGIMQLVGGADVDRVDGAIREQRVHAVIGLGNARLRREPRAALGSAAGHGRHLAVGLGADRIDHPFPGDRARPDQPPAHRIAHVLALPTMWSAIGAVPPARSPRQVATPIAPLAEIPSLEPIEQPADGGFQRTELAGDDDVDHLVVDAMIGVPQDIADAGDLPPRQSGLGGF